jgi:prepilin-type N-terminal cleavage/methylation domain-containing protein
MKNILNKRNSGFTIVELLIVIVVIAILATIVIVAYNGITNRANDSRRMSDLESISKTLEEQYVDTGSYPNISCFSGWACWSTLVGITYMVKTPQDPTFFDDGKACGNPNTHLSRAYFYSATNGGKGYQLGTYMQVINISDPHYVAPNSFEYGCGDFINYLYINK